MSINVLLIEANPGDARLVREELRGAHSKVSIQLEWVDCLAKGLERLATNHIHAVLLGLSLPDSEGFDTLESVLAHAPQLPVIVMTGETDEEVGTRTVQAGAQDYLIKGQVDGRLLTRVLQHAIQRKQTELQLADALEFKERMLVSSPIGIFTYRLTGECLSANTAAANMVGGTIEQLKSQNFHQIESWKRSGLYQMATETITTGQPASADVHVVTSFGREAWYTAQFTLFRSGGEELLLMMFSDITERKEAEMALEASERRFRDWIENSSDIVTVVDSSGVIQYESPSVKRLLGYAPEDLLGKNAFDFVYPEDQDRMVSLFVENLQRPEGVASAEFRFRARDGSWRYLEAVGRAYVDEFDEVVGLINSRDISDRKRAEEQIILQANLLAAVGSAVIGVDLNGRVIYWNAAAEKLYGWSASEALGRLIGELAPARQSQEQAQEIMAQLSMGKSWSGEFTAQRKDGTEFPVFVSNSPLLDANGKLTGIISVLNDISELKQAEEARRDTETRYQALMESSVEAIYLYELEARKVVAANPAFLKLLGYEAEEITELTLYDVAAHEKDSIDGFLQKVLSEGGTSMGERFWRRKDGSTILMEVTANRIRQRDRDLIFVVGRDITERKQAEAALKASERRYRDLAENFPNGVVSVYNRDLILVFDAGLELKESGYTADDFVGRHFTELAPQETWETARTHLEGAFDGKVSAYEAPGWDGQYYRVNVAPLHGANGEIDEILVVSQNITSLKKTELTLREKEHLLSEAQRIGQIGSWSYDIPTDTIKFSDEMYSLLDILPEEFQHNSQDFLALVYPSDRSAAAQWLQDMKAGVQARKLDFRMFRKNGELRYLQCGGATDFDYTGKPMRFIATTQDITDRKVAELQIDQQLRRLTALAEIDLAIISSFDQRYTLGVILSQVTSQLQVDAVSILLLDSQRQMLTYAAGRGFRTKMIEQARFPIGTDYAGRVAEERRMIRVLDVKETTHSSVFNEFLIAEGFVSYIGVPLMVKGTVKGVLEVFHRATFLPYQEWLDFFNILAGQAALAVENASLFGNLQTTNEELFDAYDATIEGWSRAMDLRDRETEGHTQRVTSMTLKLARALGLEESQLTHIRRGALLHDIGKLGVPDHILFKPDRLNAEEREIMKMHAEFAFKMLAPIDYLKPALNIPYCHHERWDGTGYPLGLKGEQIPLEARIFAVADVWDALSSDRPYRKAWPADKTLNYIREQSGKHFDPQVVQCFLQIMKVQ